jgi:hypothetical protein
MDIAEPHPTDKLLQACRGPESIQIRRRIQLEMQVLSAVVLDHLEEGSVVRIVRVRAVLYEEATIDEPEGPVPRDRFGNVHGFPQILRDRNNITIWICGSK